MRERLRPSVRSLVALAILSVLAAPAAIAQQTPELAVPADARTAPLDQLVPVAPNVTVGELSNGLRYFIRENRATKEQGLL